MQLTFFHIPSRGPGGPFIMGQVSQGGITMLASLLEKLQGALKSPACAQCAQALPHGGERLFCPPCAGQLGLRPPEPLIALPDYAGFAASHFTPPLKRLIYGYKFYERHQDVPLLADILIDYWKQVPLGGLHPENTAVVPVPPHAGKTPHLAPVARRFARHFGYEYAPQSLAWVRETAPQHSLEGRRARYRNVAHGMAVPENAWRHWQRVIILDDLTTTGATLAEAARAMAKANLPGAPELITLAVAKVLAD